MARGLLIPDDWDGETWRCIQVQWPNSDSWHSLFLGAMSRLMHGRVWDEDSGTITEVQETATDIWLANKDMNECEMDNPIVGLAWDCATEKLIATFRDETTEDFDLSCLNIPALPHDPCEECPAEGGKESIDYPEIEWSCCYAGRAAEAFLEDIRATLSALLTGGTSVGALATAIALIVSVIITGGLALPVIFASVAVGIFGLGSVAFDAAFSTQTVFDVAEKIYCACQRHGGFTTLAKQDVLDWIEATYTVYPVMALLWNVVNPLTDDALELAAIWYEIESPDCAAFDCSSEYETTDCDVAQGVGYLLTDIVNIISDGINASTPAGTVSQQVAVRVEQVTGYVSTGSDWFPIVQECMWHEDWFTEMIAANITLFMCDVLDCIEANPSDTGDQDECIILAIDGRWDVESAIFMLTTELIERASMENANKAHLFYGLEDSDCEDCVTGWEGLIAIFDQWTSPSMTLEYEGSNTYVISSGDEGDPTYGHLAASAGQANEEQPFRMLSYDVLTGAPHFGYQRDVGSWSHWFVGSNPDAIVASGQCLKRFYFISPNPGTEFSVRVVVEPC